MNTTEVKVSYHINHHYMRKEDISKLVKAGYKIIRADKSNNTIKTISTGQYSHGWKTLEKGFKTYADVEKRMNELLKDEKTIEH